MAPGPARPPSSWAKEGETGNRAKAELSEFQELSLDLTLTPRKTHLTQGWSGILASWVQGGRVHSRLSQALPGLASFSQALPVSARPAPAGSGATVPSDGPACWLCP